MCYPQLLYSQWQPCNGISGGDIFSFALSGNNVFAVMDAYGVFLSTNNGSSWLQTGLNHEQVWSLVIKGSNIFAGTNDSGVYLSKNNGSNWVHIGMGDNVVYSLTVSGNNIYAGTNSSGVYVTTNNGTNWIKRNNGFPNRISLYSLCASSTFLFAGTQYSTYRRLLSEFIGIHPRSGNIPVLYRLYQNYPNPFNPSTKIKFDLKEDGRLNTEDVKLIIYDILGKKFKLWSMNHYSLEAMKSHFTEAIIHRGFIFIN